MNKTVLITGASRGIGRETAKLFAKNGYRVIINYNKSDKEANSLKDELLGLNCDCITAKADVSKIEEVEKMMDDVRAFSSHIDVLVNNAGVALRKLLCDTTEEEWDTLFNVNIKGIFNCTKAVLPRMIRQKSGKIVNISSILGINGAACEVAYSATKAAVIGFTQALAKEIGPCNITVNCVAPGVIETDMNKNLNSQDLDRIKDKTPLERIGQPIDIANFILFLASEDADFITRQVFNINGGLVL